MSVGPRQSSKHADASANVKSKPVITFTARPGKTVTTKLVSSSVDLRTAPAP